MSTNHQRLTNVLLLISFLDYLAVSLVYPLMGIRIRELGASQFFSGLISSSYGAIQLFSATAHGIVCDRFGRRLTLIFCLVFITCSYFALSFTVSFLGILLIRSVLGMVKHTQATFKVIGGDVNTGTSRSTFISKSNTLSGLAFMIGPFLGAYFFSPETSFQYGCWWCTGIFLLILPITYVFVDETLPAMDSVKSYTSNNSSSSILQRFRKYKSLQHILIYRFCAALSVIILRYFTPLYTQHYFGFNAKHAGYMTSFIGFSGIICSSLAGYVAWLVPKKLELTKYLSLLLVLSILLTLFSSTMSWFLVTQFILSFSTQNLRIMVDSLILSAASDTDRGEIFGLGASVIGLCRVGGPMIAGSLAEVHMMFPLVCSVTLAGAGSIVLFTSKLKQS